MGSTQLSESKFEHRNWGLLCAVLSTGLSSVAIVFQATSAKQINPILLAAISNLVGGVFLWVVARILGFISTGPNRAQLSGKWRALLMLVILRNFLGAMLFWWGLSLTLGIKAMFFTKAEPYFVLFWNWVFERKKIPRKHLGLLFVHILGALMLSVGDLSSLGISQVWDLIIVLAVVVLALSYRYGASLVVDLGALNTTIFSQCIGGLLMLPLAALIGGLEFKADPSAWANFFTAVFLWNVFGVVCWFVALKSVETWIVSALRALGPVIAAPIAWYFFSEVLSPLQIAGGVVVLATSVMISLDRSGMQGENKA